MAFSRKRAFEWLVDYAVNMLRDFSDSKEDGGVEVQAEILPRAKVGNLAMAAAVGGEPPSKKLKSSTMGGVLPTGPAKENAMAAGKAAGGRKKKSMSPGQPAIQLVSAGAQPGHRSCLLAIANRLFAAHVRAEP